jgi:hypothetical protein
MYEIRGSHVSGHEKYGVLGYDIVVWNKFMNSVQECAVSTFRVQESLLPWKWKE